MFHNAALYNTHRSSEDGHADLAPVLPEDIPTPGPQEQQSEGEEGPDLSQEANEVPTQQSNDNHQPDGDSFFGWDCASEGLQNTPRVDEILGERCQEVRGSHCLLTAEDPGETGQRVILRAAVRTFGVQR